MQAVGLITEYNPFHNGHKYHVQQAKAVSGADVVVAVMSGNYVQRGEPAVFDKWDRTQLALAGGVNLLAELPFAFAVQPAHIFATGAVRLLADMGVSSIVFGAEHATLDFLEIAKQAQAALNDTQNFTGDYSQTYATQFNDVVETIVGFRIDHPNDLLGLAYAQAVLALNLESKVRLLPIQRQQAQYHDQTLNTANDIASATALRRQATTADHAVLKRFMSDEGALLLTQGPAVKSFDTAWLAALLYKVKTTPVDELEKIYQLNDGLAYRLHALIERRDYTTMTELLTDFKSKRYTQSRLQRSLLYTILNVTHVEMQTVLQQPYIRFLGMDQLGRKYVKQQRDQFTLPVINRVSQDEINGILKLDYRAGALYHYFEKTPGAVQDTGRIPVYYER